MSSFRMAVWAIICLGIFSPPVRATPALVSTWEFNGAWTSSNDPSYDLVPAGGAQLVPSPNGMAASFAGGFFSGPTNPGLAYADSIAQPTSASFNSGLSIVGTIRPQSVVGLSFGGLLSHDTSFGSLSRLGFALAVDYDDMSLLLQLRDTSDNRLLAATVANSVIDGAWQTVAVTWDGSTNGGIQMYIGGVAVTTNITPSGTFAGLNGGDLSVRVGASFADSVGGLYGYSGQVDCLSLWNGTITANQASGACASVPEPSSILLMASSLIGLGVAGAQRRRRSVIGS